MEVVESCQKWFAECLSSRGGSYPAATPVLAIATFAEAARAEATMTLAETGTAKAPHQRAGQAIITQRATYNAKPGANRKQHTVVGVVRGWCCGTPSAVHGATSPLPVAMGAMSQIATQHGNAAVRVSCCQLIFMQIGKARFMRQRGWQTKQNGALSHFRSNPMPLHF